MPNWTTLLWAAAAPRAAAMRAAASAWRVLVIRFLLVAGASDPAERMQLRGEGVADQLVAARGRVHAVGELPGRGARARTQPVVRQAHRAVAEERGTVGHLGVRDGADRRGVARRRRVVRDAVLGRVVVALLEQRERVDDL